VADVGPLHANLLAALALGVYGAAASRRSRRP
jgi:hypothetical protein